MTAACYSFHMKIYCSGIGGIGLSAYAAHMKTRGHEVMGSDKAASAVTEDLVKQGVAVALKQDGSAMPGELDLFVYSEAIPETAPERMKATLMKVRQMSYFQALGELCAGGDVIAVCGTHGKSSTTAMAARVFMNLGLDPNVVVGTKMKELGGRNWRKGAGNLWIVEACEYRRSFLHIKPTTILITNADGDHFDAFKDQADYESAFVEFASKLPSDGKVIGHGADATVKRVAEKSKKAFLDADTQPLTPLKTPGLHMQKNAQLVLALAEERGVDVAKAGAELAGFEGTWRRMEVKGVNAHGITVIDDYAHHPVEIRATIAAIKKEYPRKRLVCVFEPHTNDRVLKLWKDFTTSFTQADLLLVTKVFDARPDKDAEQADVAKFAAEIGRTSKVACRPTGSLEKTKVALETLQHENDVLLIMGAGNSTKLADAMML